MWSMSPRKLQLLQSKNAPHVGALILKNKSASYLTRKINLPYTSVALDTN